MTLPRTFYSLPFRISAVFLVLLAFSAMALYLWIDATIFHEETVPGEKEWYESLAATELDSLARAMQPFLTDLPVAEHMLVNYGELIRRFDAEAALLDEAGRLLSSTSPESLSLVLREVDTFLLQSMSANDWDYQIYPNSHDFDAYENRIFHVSPLWSVVDSSGPPAAYLVASSTPVDVAVGEMEHFERNLRLQTLVVILIAAAVSWLISMVWLGRRFRVITRGVRTFHSGDLGHRIPVRSRDEIGELSAEFNTMASRLATTIDQLKHSEQFHRQIVANISHDLRTPLTTVGGYVETLVDRSEMLTSKERRQYLQIIASNVDHLNRLIHHLLQLSQLDSGRARFQKEDFQVEELVTEVLDRYRRMAQAQGVSLSVQSAGNLPPVNADPLQIDQALQNLVENGIKFNRPSGTVAVQLRRCGDEVEVAVRDSGVGIAPQDLPNIFDRFYTADKSRSLKGQSSGLGLAIASKILAGHDRELTVDSSLDEGTAFFFTLPVATPLQEESGS